MQNDQAVGRVLLASLHRSIEEILPARLEFYETWLKPSEPHHPTDPATPFTDMLRFLQGEGEAFDLVTRRAGEYAAVHFVEELRPVRRSFMRVLPHSLRERMALRLVGRMLTRLGAESADLTRRGSTIFIDLEGSPFCAAREREEHPAVGFYGSAITTFLQSFNLHAAVRVSRASRGKSCLLLLLTDKVRVAGPEGSILGLTRAPSTPTPQPAPAQAHVEPPVSEPTPPLDLAAEGAAAPSKTVPGDVDVAAAMDREQIEMQWNTIAAIPTSAAEPPASAAEPAPSGTEAPPALAIENDEDPETLWQRL